MQCVSCIQMKFVWVEGDVGGDWVRWSYFWLCVLVPHKLKEQAKPATVIIFHSTSLIISNTNSNSLVWAVLASWCKVRCRRLESSVVYWAWSCCELPTSSRYGRTCPESIFYWPSSCSAAVCSWARRILTSHLSSFAGRTRLLCIPVGRNNIMATIDNNHTDECHRYRQCHHKLISK